MSAARGYVRPGRVSRSEHRDQTRAALLDSARRLFAARGYHDVSAEEIAIDAGVTERTLFRYFPTKASLVLDNFIQLTPELMALIGERPPEESPYTAICESVIALARAHPELLARDPGPDWSSLALPDSERERVLVELVGPLAETLRVRYRLPASDRLRPVIWARAGVAALTYAISLVAQRQRETGERVRVGQTVRRAFAALDGAVPEKRGTTAASGPRAAVSSTDRGRRR